jgi:hypothetical protein
VVHQAMTAATSEGVSETLVLPSHPAHRGRTASVTARRQALPKSHALGFLAVSDGFGDQVGVVAAWRVDEGVVVSLAA